MFQCVIKLVYRISVDTLKVYHVETLKMRKRGCIWNARGFGSADFSSQEAKMKLFPTFPFARALRGHRSVEKKFL